nr:unnamed protein product [Callosobruchus analis]
MSENRLNGLANLNIHRWIQVDTNEVLAILKEKGPRRLDSNDKEQGIRANINFTCKNCDDIGSTLADLKAVVQFLQEEIRSLKAAKTEVIPPIESIDFEQVVQEVSDRNAREEYLIIYGMKEGAEPNSRQARATNTEQVKSILRCVSNDISPESITPRRLGKPRYTFIMDLIDYGTLLYRHSGLQCGKDYGMYVRNYNILRLCCNMFFFHSKQSFLCEPGLKQVLFLASTPAFAYLESIAVW